jgi:hypothetical protein
LDAPAVASDQDEVSRRTTFRDQLDQRELAAVQALFGTAPRSRPGSTPTGQATTADRQGLGAVAVDDCYATARLDATRWREVCGARPGQDQAATREWLAEHGLHPAHHVAIDRWIGGAASGRLFSLLEPHRLGWEPLRLVVDPRRLRRAPGASGDAALALLLLVLRDLRHGRVPIGYGTNRGLGAIEVTGVDISGHSWPDGVGLDDLLSSEHAGELTKAWQAYLGEGRQ